MVVQITEKICGLCNRKISLSDNLSGLVFDDEHFLCEECSSNNSHDVIDNWTKSFMQKTSEGMPVALWVIQEQNKDKTLMSRKM
jgi:hypothetical protein